MTVSLSFIGGAGWQFFDDNGDPLSGGKIYTYAAGTTTPATTYTSRDGLTPNTNPIILDAAGRCPAEIWSTEGDLYKYVLRTSANVLIRTWDNVGGSFVSSDLSVDLANTTDNNFGDALVGFRQSNSAGFFAGSVGKTLNAKMQEFVSVLDFGADPTGVADSTTALQSAITAAATANTNRLSFPRGTYRFSSPLTISGIDVDFQKSTLLYSGTSGSFALTLVSDAGAGINQRNGNRFSDFTLRQENWANYVTYSGSTAYGPVSLSSYANITNIVPNALSTSVAVPGARIGGYARATFSTLVDGCVVTAAVTADDIVTVWFNSYVSAPINMLAGTLNVTVVNNAFHGLCLGGTLGTLENAKVIGFTGVSLALGDGREQITGVNFSGSQQCYYWKVHANVAPAAGWGIVVKPRNNENTFNLSLFPINAYNDPIPRRACCINQVVMSGVTNGFEALSLESVSSEAALLITDAGSTITSSKVIYYESNTAFAYPPAPYVLAQTYSSGCSLSFRIIGDFNAILDKGVGNDIYSTAAFYINGRNNRAPAGGPNLVFNGDFLNQINGWANFSSGATAITYPGPGYLSGKRIRIDVTAGRVNLQQAVDTVGRINIANFVGKTLTAGAWVRTNLGGIVCRLNGLANASIPSDEQWHFSNVTMRNESATDLDLSIIAESSTLQTGYVEISNVTCVIGLRATPFESETAPQGSVVYDPPNILSGNRATTTVSVPGVVLGDLVVGVSFSQDVAGLTLTGYVSAADTATVVFQNDTGGAVNLASGTLRVLTRKA